MIRFILVAAAIAVAAPVSLAAAELGVLTLSGSIEKSNRGPSSTDDPTLLGTQGFAFNKGCTMSLDDLLALPQVERQAHPPGEKTSVTYSGPLITDVLDAVGASGEAATVTGVDGYAPEIPMATIEAHDPILAVTRNGAPMAIGDQGPLVMVWPASDDAELAEDFKRWEVWGVYYVGVR